MWQIITIITLLAVMISRQFFDLHGAVGDLNPDTLAATGFIILAAFTMGELFKRLKMPALLGYIAAGIVFGPDLSELVLGTDRVAIFGREVIVDLGLINVLTIGVIGTLGGGELKLDDLKSQASTILTVIVLSFLVVVPLSAAAVFGVAAAVPDLVPFLAGTTTAVKLAVSLLFGVFGFAMSPTATLAIIQETNARGRFTSLTLGVVIVADLVLVASFLLVFNFSQLLIGPAGLSAQAVRHLLVDIGLEFGWALVIGVVTGGLFILYLRFVAREKLLFTVGLLFAGSAVADMVHAEKLLVFLTAGFIVQNVSKHGEDMIHALEKISLPVFVIYFMTQAAQLDLMAVAEFLPLALILTLVRGAGLFGSVKLATRLRQAPEYIDSNLWMAFFSRGGVDIVLAGLVAAEIGPWGQQFSAVILATVVIHIIAGPVILKWVFERVGETADARQAGTEEVAELDRIVGDDHQASYEPLERPDFPDRRLDARLAQVNDALSQCYQSCLVDQIEQHGQHLEHLLGRVNDVRGQVLSQLAEVLAEDDTDQRDLLAGRVKRLHVQFRQTLQPQIDLLEHLDPMPITPETTERLLERVRGLVDFDETYRVRMEPWLLDAGGDGAAMSAIKLIRRMRRIYGRGGHRTVPLGRLWRFHVELSMPGYLASAVAATAERNETFWQRLGVHLRRIDDLFERVLRQLQADSTTAPDDGDQDGDDTDADDADVAVFSQSGKLFPSVDALPMSMPADADLPGLDDTSSPGPADSPTHSEPDDSAAEPADAQPPGKDPADRPSPLDAARADIERSRQQLHQEADGLDSRLGLFLQTLRERFSFSIERAYDDFIEATAKAGTIELPAFRYRASSRYDEAHRAEARLKDRLDREADLVDGYQGWIVLDHQLILFLHWFRTFQQRIVATLEARFEKGTIRHLRQLRSRCEERPSSLEADAAKPEAAKPDWPRWFSEQLDPVLESARQALDHALTDFAQGIITRRLMDALEARVARFSSQVNLLVQNPGESVDQTSDVDTTIIPLRAWYFSKLLRETALGLVEFNERAERILRRSLVGLGEIRQGLETALVGNQHTSDQPTAGQPDQPEPNGRDELTDADDVADAGLHQAVVRVDKFIDQIQTDDHQTRRWVIEESTQIVHASTIPFLEHRLTDVAHELGRPGADNIAQRSVRPLLSRLKAGYQRLAPVVDQIRGDLARRLGAPDAPGRAPADKPRVRRRLLRIGPDHQADTPAVYRRLFSPVPVDIPDFYVERPALERDCMRAVERWFDGRPTSILISGDRGMGKRTFVHHVLPVRLFSRYAQLDESQLQTVRINEQVDTEPQLCAAFDSLVDGNAARTLGELTRRLKALAQKQIVFVENGAKIYSRTRDGLSLSERFLAMTEHTSSTVLWIVLMTKPATTLLDTAVQISDYFTHSLDVESLTSNEIEEMIMARHDASGFELDFRPPDIRYLDRIGHPWESADAIRHPRNAYFERLGRLSGGVPLLALLHWLESVEWSADDATRIVVHPLPERRLSLVEPLSIQKKLLLATLVQHRALSAPRLSRIVRVGLDEVKSELNHLRRLGFVTFVATTSTYHLRTLPDALVTQELRALNLV